MPSPRPAILKSAFRTYRNMGQIGHGGAGTVVKVEDDRGEVFAAKYLAPENLSSDKQKRFQNELAFCSRCEHSNVIKVLDWGLVEVREVECPFYVMPFYPSNLRQLLRNGIAANDVMAFFAQILDGIEAAHLLGVCHRDLKPENVLFDEATGLLVVADFGIARFAEPLMQTMVVTKPSTRLANFQYAAPEQIERERNVDQRADICALGLMLNEMFTGRIPHGQGYAEIVSVSPEHAYLDELVRSMLMQDPADRPASIADVKQQLIARGEQAAREQKLSELRHAVIPKTEVDDALVLDPPQLCAANWDAGTLTMTLDRPVNPDWTRCFHDPGSRQALLGYGPETFSVSGSQIQVRCEGRLAQRLIDFSKQYIQQANTQYRMMVEAADRERQAREEADLKRRIEQAEETRAINESLKL
jgi:serine/threonine protein kinase